MIRNNLSADWQLPVENTFHLQSNQNWAPRLAQIAPERVKVGGRNQPKPYRLHRPRPTGLAEGHLAIEACPSGEKFSPKLWGFCQINVVHCCAAMIDCGVRCHVCACVCHTDCWYLRFNISIAKVAIETNILPNGFPIVRTDRFVAVMLLNYLWSSGRHTVWLRLFELCFWNTIFVIVLRIYYRQRLSKTLPFKSLSSLAISWLFRQFLHHDKIQR